MRRKSEAFQTFKSYHAMSEKHTGQSIQSLRSDNGGEYISNDFKSYLSSLGIQHQLTVPYTPQQNGVAERMNRTLLDLVRSMLHSRSIPKKFWAEALATAVYVRNRSISSSLPRYATPFHLWNETSPDVSHLRVFGCPCWYTVPRHRVQKLDPRSRQAMMLGYSTQSKAYRVWDDNMQKVVISRDVKFAEQLGDLAHKPKLAEDHPSGSRKAVTFADTEPLRTANQGGDESDTQHNTVLEHPENTPTAADPSTVGSAPLRRSQRVSQPPERFSPCNFVANLDAELLNIGETRKSYSDAVSGDHSEFWKPGIAREESCLTRNENLELLQERTRYVRSSLQVHIQSKKRRPKSSLGCTWMPTNARC